MALSYTAPAWVHLTSTARWWVEVSATVNAFRAGVMRGMAVAADERGRAQMESVGPVMLYMAPYKAAGKMKKAFEALFPMTMPEYGTSSNMAKWADDVVTRVGWIAADRRNDLHREAPRRQVVDHTAYFGRAQSLLDPMGVQTLGDWMRQTFSDVAADLQRMMDEAERVRALVATTKAPEPDEGVAEAMAEAAKALEESLQIMAEGKESDELYEEFMRAVDDDAWDDYLIALNTPAMSEHAGAKAIAEAAKELKSSADAAELALAVNREFGEMSDEEGAAVY
jgi:hypothetical protein